MKDSRLVKEVISGMLEGETRRGRPCREWLDNIKKWCGEETHTLNRNAQDRTRTVVKTALDTNGL